MIAGPIRSGDFMIRPRARWQVAAYNGPVMAGNSPICRPDADRVRVGVSGRTDRVRVRLKARPTRIGSDVRLKARPTWAPRLSQPSGIRAGRRARARRTGDSPTDRPWPGRSGGWSSRSRDPTHVRRSPPGGGSWRRSWLVHDPATQARPPTGSAAGAPPTKDHRADRGVFVGSGYWRRSSSDRQAFSLRGVAVFVTGTGRCRAGPT